MTKPLSILIHQLKVESLSLVVKSLLGWLNIAMFDGSTFWPVKPFISPEFPVQDANCANFSFKAGRIGSFRC
jgi:hypothetical protein